MTIEDYFLRSHYVFILSNRRPIEKHPFLLLKISVWRCTKCPLIIQSDFLHLEYQLEFFERKMINTDLWIHIYIGKDFDCNTCDIAFWFELVPFIANLTIVVWKTITCNLLPFERNRRKNNKHYIYTHKTIS